MKYIIKESQYYNAIDKFITYQLEPHEEKRIEKHPGAIFWVKDGEVISEIKKSRTDWNCYAEYTPEKVMKIFNNVFLKFTI
jgi:hypothetical protein